jgi:large subunit ribosomal protein L3
MSIEIICRKLGMTQLYVESGEAIPVTVLAVSTNVVTQKKSSDGADGYDAIQLAAEERREKLVTRPEKGHYAKAGVTPKRHVKESRLDADAIAEIEVGQEFGLGLFEEGLRVDVAGTSKGRGYQGVVKRHNFKVKKRTHGTHEAFRHAGSIGAGASPGRVWKGGKQAGQMGNARVTAKNLEVVRLDVERNLIFVRGAVPGHNNGVVHVRTAVGTGH